MDTPDFLDGLWYMVAPGQSLRPGKTLGVTLAGRPLALARDDAGKVMAIRDICPHRGMPFSYGRAVNGTFECPYHGWRFNGAGHCVKIPSLVAGQDVDVAKIAVESFEVVERHGLIWVFLGPREQAAAALIPDLPFMGRVSPDMIESQIFPCHLDHAVIGLMDPAHGPYVHAAWWWRTERSMHHKAKDFAPNDLGFTMVAHKPSRNSAFYKILGGPKTTEIAFRLPGIRIETIRAGRSVVNILTSVTPIDAARTRVTSVLYWDLHGVAAILPLFKPLLARFATRFLGQDRDAVIKQQDGLKHDPKLMLINDADTQARWYFQLKHLFAKARAEGTAFANPLKPTKLEWNS